MTELTNALLVSRAIITDEDRILVLRRTQEDLHNAGLWEFPGGKVDADETVEDGLAREVFEETGLIIGAASSIAHVETELIKSGKYEGRLYVALFYAAKRLSGDLALSDEHSDVLWEEPRFATERVMTPQSRRALTAFLKQGII